MAIKLYNEIIPTYTGETYTFDVYHTYSNKKTIIVQLRRADNTVVSERSIYRDTDLIAQGRFAVPSAGTYYGYAYIESAGSLKGSTFTVIDKNAAPTAPSAITIPTLKAGKPAAISWGAATDSDGTIAAYELSRQMDGGAWAVVGTTTSLSMADTIGEDWTSVAYRVRAQDNAGAWSGYTTSAAVEVKPACGIPVTIDGIERELDALYCTIDGVVRPVEMAAGIDGVTREIF